MTSRTELRRVAVQCLGCGAVYAAEEWPDGSVRPIGQRAGCTCGESELRVMASGEPRRCDSRPVG